MPVAQAEKKGKQKIFSEYLSFVAQSLKAIAIVVYFQYTYITHQNRIFRECKIEFNYV